VNRRSLAAIGPGSCPASRGAGFTLVEVLVTSGVLVIVLGALFLAFATGGGTVRRGMETVDVLSTTSLALEHLKRDLRALEGEVPLPRYVSPDELTVSFMRCDGFDGRSHEARLVPVTYRFWVRPDRKRATLVRDQNGHRTVFAFDRDVSFELGADPASSLTTRAVQIRFTFPRTADSPANRPSIRTTVIALDRGSQVRPPADPAQGRPSPPGAGPWTVDGTAPITPVDSMFPPSKAK
jgi:type II secretory pathway pseudopilin PulG